MKKLFNLLGTILLFFVVFSFINPADSYAWNTIVEGDGSFIVTWNAQDIAALPTMTNGGGCAGDHMPYTLDFMLNTDPSPLDNAGDNNNNYDSFNTGFNGNPLLATANQTSDSFYGYSSSNGDSNLRVLVNYWNANFDCSSSATITYITASHPYTDLPVNDTTLFYTPSPTNAPAGYIVDPSQQEKVNNAIGSIPTTAMSEVFAILPVAMPWILLITVIALAFFFVKWWMKKHYTPSGYDIESHALKGEAWQGNNRGWVQQFEEEK